MKNGTTWYSDLCYYGNVKFKGAEPEGGRSFVLGGLPEAGENGRWSYGR